MSFIATAKSNYGLIFDNFHLSGNVKMGVRKLSQYVRDRANRSARIARLREYLESYYSDDGRKRCVIIDGNNLAYSKCSHKGFLISFSNYTCNPFTSVLWWRTGHV